MTISKSKVLLMAGLMFLAACAKEDTRIHAPTDVNRAGVRIGIMTGSTSEGLAKDRFPKAELKRFDDNLDAVAALKANQVDVTITAFPQALQLAKTNPDLEVIAERLDDEPTAAAVRKGDTALLGEINEMIAQLRSDGTLADMEKRWFKRDLSPYIEPVIDVPTSGTPLRIGVAATREPVSFVDNKGRISGFDGELVRRLGARLRRPIAFTNVKFLALIPALQSGKIDAIFTGMSATDERRKFVDFSERYFDNAQVLVVRKSGAAPTNAAHGLSLAKNGDAEDKRVAVLLGSAHEAYITGNWHRSTPQNYQTLSDMLLAIRAGKAEVGLCDTAIVDEAVHEDPALAEFGEPLLPFDLGVGFNKKSPDLLDEFNQFLLAATADGTLDDMRRRWIEMHGREMPDLGPPPAGEPLVVGTSSDGLPFEAVVEDHLAGFDIEMLERFGRKIGRPIRFVTMPFASLIAAVSSGKVDAIASSIFITEERKKLIDFSRPYHQATSRLFALRTNVASSASEAGAAHAPAPPGFWEKTRQSFRANILTEKRYLLLWVGLKVTVLISLLSVILGTLLGAGVCTMRLSRHVWLRTPAKAYIGLLRGLPVLVLLMLIFYVIFASVDIPAVLVAVIAFGMNFAAYAAEIFRSGIEGIDKGQTEAGLAMGFTRLQTFAHIVLPQMVRRVLPVYKGEFISMVKMTSIVGYIAVQDLTKASDIIRSRTFDAFFPLVMVAVLYFLIAWLLIQLLEVLESRLDPRSRRKGVAR